MANLARWSMAVGCGLILVVAVAGGAAAAANHDVTIEANTFQPADVTIAPGDSVTWTNRDAERHDATAADESWGTGNIFTNSSRSVTFATVGIYRYHCTIHPTMEGRVTVSDTLPATDGEQPAAPVGPSSIGLGAVIVLGVLASAAVVMRRGRAN